MATSTNPTSTQKKSEIGIAKMVPFWFFQSKLWIDIMMWYGYDIIWITYWTEQYIAVKKRIAGMNYLQLLGIPRVFLGTNKEDIAMDLNYYQWFSDYIKNVCKIHNCDFAHIGFITPLTQEQPYKTSILNWGSSTMVKWQMRELLKLPLRNCRYKEKQISEQCGGMKESISHNMPEATIIYVTNEDGTPDLTPNTQARRNIKKIEKKKDTLKIVKIDKKNDSKLYDEFYAKRFQTLVINKGMYIPSKANFDSLKDNDSIEIQCVIDTSWDNDVMVAGNIYILDKKHWQVIYLYGFVSRGKWLDGLGQWFTVQMIEHYFTQWYTSYETLGVASLVDENSSLASVTRFKESLGWLRYEFIGNYDVIANPIKYYVFRMLSELKSWVKKLLQKLK